MKYVLLGTLSTDWAAKHGQRVESATAKLKELGITLEAIYLWVPNIHAACRGPQRRIFPPVQGQPVTPVPSENPVRGGYRPPISRAPLILASK